MNKLIDWYLSEMPKYIKKWEGVDGYEDQVQHAKDVLDSFNLLMFDFANVIGLDLTGYKWEKKGLY